jgi:hypothetical protein
VDVSANKLKVLKCGAGEGWKRSFGTIMRDVEECNIERVKEVRNVIYTANGRKVN